MCPFVPHFISEAKNLFILNYTYKFSNLTLKRFNSTIDNQNKSTCRNAMPQYSYINTIKVYHQGLLAVRRPQFGYHLLLLQAYTKSFHRMLSVSGLVTRPPYQVHSAKVIYVYGRFIAWQPFNSVQTAVSNRKVINGNKVKNSIGSVQFLFRKNRLKAER